MNFESGINQLKDTLIVMAEIQRRQAEVQRMQAEGTALHEQRMKQAEESMALHDQRMNHIDLRLAEITDKLDGLIGFMDGQFRRPQ
jgi:hypothetical protein